MALKIKKSPIHAQKMCCIEDDYDWTAVPPHIGAEKAPSLQVQENHLNFVIPYPFNGGIPGSPTVFQAASRKAIRQGFSRRFSPYSALCTKNHLLTLLAHRVNIIQLLKYNLSICFHIDCFLFLLGTSSIKEIRQNKKGPPPYIK